MRASSLVALPLRTAFARSSTPSRGGSGVLCAGFHVLSGHHSSHRYLRWSQEPRAPNKQRHRYDGLRDGNTGPRGLVVRFLNRVMLEPYEVVEGEEGRLSVTLPAADSRTAHIRGVLKGESGEFLRVGVVNAGRMDDAEITWVEPVDPPPGAPPPDIPGRQKDRKSSPKWMDLVIDLGPNQRQLLQPIPQERRPKVALMLAVPRPLQLERILPIVASLGVTTLVLCQAKKVPKFYFGSHFFRDPQSIRTKLIEGLSQCGETVLPQVVVARRLTIFLEDELERHFPKDRWVRVLAHPTRLPPQIARGAEGKVPATAAGVEASIDETIPKPGLRFSQVEPPEGCDPADAGVLVAVGPEGGWVEPNELQFLESFGFQAVTLGSRVLRSDVAVSALLALAHAWVEEREHGGHSPSASAQMRSPEE
ncbi:unnamed protein product [Pylaiella littoralis]